MSEAARYRQRARRFEQSENWARAIEAYELAIEADKKAHREVDLSLYNRIGDLYRRIGDVNKAVYYYDAAVDGHIAAGFYNNAIALCNKILRNQPNRHTAYLKLGKIGAAKGFLSDARRHFLEYAERMQKAGQLDQAFAALVEFADLSPDPEVRLMIADQLIEHDRYDQAVEQMRLGWRDLIQEGRDADAQDVRERIIELAPERDPEIDPPEEATATVVDAEGVLELPELEPLPEEPESESLGMDETEVEAERDSLDIVPTALVDREAGAAADEPGGEAGSVEVVSTAMTPQEPAEGATAAKLDDYRVAELEMRLAVEGPAPGLLIELADALLETGRREEATEHLGAALELCEREGQYQEAERVIDELLRLDVNDLRAYQKRVELALRAGGRSALIDAYLELADCLDRTDAGNKARAVYARVLELDPQNRRARAAMELLGEEAPPEPPAEEAPEVPAEEAPEMSAEEAPPEVSGPGATVEDAAVPSADQFVDLGTLVLEEDKKDRSTRFRVSAADPRSEAEVNFAEMLDQFKTKVAEAIEEEDAASHYDLGVAFKEMGLVDEAIAEFQIAARGMDYRLRAIEMLGACFLEKEDYRIALKVLSRALQVPDYRDEELIGIFYSMGRAHEALGETDSAVEWYERVIGCDVHFADAARRVSALRPS